MKYHVASRSGSLCSFTLLFLFIMSIRPFALLLCLLFTLLRCFYLDLDCANNHFQGRLRSWQTHNQTSVARSHNKYAQSGSHCKRKLVEEEPASRPVAVTLSVTVNHSLEELSSPASASACDLEHVLISLGPTLGHVHVCEQRCPVLKKR